MAKRLAGFVATALYFFRVVAVGKYNKLFLPV
jgi:hypothetical protein